MPREDLVLALALALTTALSRVPFRARLLPTWDAVQFALALDRYAIAAHQPHPPGYILYVAAGRAAEVFLGDATRSLVWLSVIASGAAVFLVYRLAWTLYGRAAAVVAAAALATSPLFWFYGEVGLPYAGEAALAASVAMATWPARGGRLRSVVWSAVCLGLAGGVRQSLLPLLLPLWATTAWIGTGRWPPLLAGAGVIAATTACWLGPMLWLAGGVGAYLAASRELFESTVRPATVLAPGAAWLVNVGGLAEAAVLGLGLLLPALVWALARAVRRGWGPREWFLAIWASPFLAVYTLAHFGQYGYLLAILPALYVLMAPAIAGAVGSGEGRRRRRVAATACLAGVLALHVGFVVGAGPVDVAEARAGAPWSERQLADVRALYRYRLWPHTARGLRETEGVVSAYADAIRRRFAPTDTVVVVELGNRRSYPWFRHVTYYLPEFRAYHLRLPPHSPGYLDSARLASMATREGDRIVLPPGVRHLVWMVDAWNPALPQPPGLRALPLPYGRWLYVLDVGRQPVEHAGYRLVPS